MSEPSKIRNVALVGHRGTGKTSLLEALLYSAGVVTRQGKVEDGTTVGDWDDDEKRRQLSLASSLAHIEADGLTFNLIDTPGDSSFQSDTIGALRVVETAVMVVNSVMGVEVQTERLWNRAADAGLARIVYCNMLDRERADFERCLDRPARGVRSRGRGGATPIGSEHEFPGVVDVLNMKAYVSTATRSSKATYRPISPTRRPPPATRCSRSSPRPATSSPRSSSTKTRSTKPSSSRVRSGGPRSQDLPGRRWRRDATRSASISCSTCWLSRRLPMRRRSPSSPASTAPGRARLRRRQAGHGVRLQDGRRSVQWPHQRVSGLPGTVTEQQRRVDSRNGHKERLGQLLKQQGKDTKQVDRLVAGDIGAVAKLKDVVTGDTLHADGVKGAFAPITYPTPLMSFAVQAKSQGRRRQGHPGPQAALRRRPDDARRTATPRPARPSSPV